MYNAALLWLQSLLLQHELGKRHFNIQHRLLYKKAAIHDKPLQTKKKTLEQIFIFPTFNIPTFIEPLI